MDTENSTEVVADVNAIPGEGEAVGTTEPQSTSMEDTAREQGWRPKDEYSGDASKWVSAETFVAKGELIAKIETLGKKLKESEKTMQVFKEHHAKVKETEFRSAIAYLKAQKKEAIETGDADKIIELDDRIADVRDTQKQQERVAAAPEVHPDFEAWVSENKLYVADSEMRSDADSMGAVFKRNNPSKTPNEVLEHVTGKIKKLYPEKFQNQSRSRPSAVEGSNGNRSAGQSDPTSLSEEEKRIMNTFLRSGIMTKEEYMKEVKAMRGAN